MAALDLSPYLQATSPKTVKQLQHRLLQSIDNESSFCNSVNIDECVSYLDKEIQVVGLASLYNSSGGLDLTSLINATHSLLMKYQRSSRYREELESRVHRSCSDLEHLQGGFKKLKLTKETLQNDIVRCEELERQLRLESSKLKSTIKSQAEEVKRLKSQLQSNENQYKHELKKKDRQLLTVKERMQQLLSGKVKSAPSLEISSCLQRADGKRSRWRNEALSTRNEEDMYKVVVGNYDRRCTILQSENSRLRELLTDVQYELSAISASQSSKNNSAIKSPVKGQKRINRLTHQLQLPIDMIYNKLAETLQDNFSELRLKSRSCGSELNSTFIVEDHNSTRLEKECRTETFKQGKLIEKFDVVNKENQDSFLGKSDRSSGFTRSPRKDRISEHISQLKMAVEEKEANNHNDNHL